MEWIEAELQEIKTKADGVVAGIDAAWDTLSTFERIKWGIARALAAAASWAAGEALDAIQGG